MAVVTIDEGCNPLDVLDVGAPPFVSLLCVFCCIKINIISYK